MGGNRRTKDRVRVSNLERQESGVDRQREVKTSLDGLLFRVQSKRRRHLKCAHTYKKYFWKEHQETHGGICL